VNQVNQLNKKRGRWLKRGSPAQIALDNSPYALSAVLGFFVLLPIHWALAVLELVAVVAGPLWMIRTVCPHCYHMNGVDCKSGYSKLAARIAPPGDPAKFKRAFTRNTIAVYPVWFLPLAGAVYIVATGGVPPLIPLVLFILVSFVIIPVKTRTVNCRKCANRKNCPWGIKVIANQNKSNAEGRQG
jgi:hypothetical protein